jgi:hypothetical protein
MLDRPYVGTTGVGVPSASPRSGLAVTALARLQRPTESASVSVSWMSGANGAREQASSKLVLLGSK